MKRLTTLIFLLFFMQNTMAEMPIVVAQLPTQELKVGDVVEIPINIFSEEKEIVSYAVELRYDKAMLRLLDVYPGLTPEFASQTQYNEGVTHSNGIWITGSARSFDENHKVINVANLKFELIAEHRLPKIELLQTGPLVQSEDFSAVEARFTVEGEVNLYNFMFDDGFE